MNQLRLKRAFEEGYRDKMRSAPRSSGFGADPAFLLNMLGRAAENASGNGHNVSRGQTYNVHSVRQAQQAAAQGGAGNGKT